jgi:DNA helicase-2/ATP-dependent DNA helicase PcrA
VFAAPDGRLDVVDWKTGSLPDDAREHADRAVQLAVYRVAFAALRGVPVGRVGAAWHYVRENRTVRPTDLLDEAGLAEILRGVPTLRGPAAAPEAR